MKKRIFAVALTLAMTAGLAACGKTKVDLCEYKGIALKSVSASDIEDKIESYVSEYFYEMREVTDPVEKGDTVYINYVGTKDGVAFEGGTYEEEDGYPLTIGSNSFIAGFEDGLIGMKVGEQRVLDLTFPENYRNTDLAGQAVKFDVTLKKNTRKFDLELNDVNVKKLLNYENVSEFKLNVDHDLNYQTYIEQLSEYLYDNCTVKNLPKDKVKEYSDQVYEYAAQSVKQYASMYGTTEEIILRQLLNFENYDALRKYCDEGAEKNVTYQCIIEEIANKEGLKVTEEILREKGAKYAEQYGFETIDELLKEVDEEKVKEAVLQDITVDFLIENAKIF